MQTLPWASSSTTERWECAWTGQAPLGPFPAPAAWSSWSPRAARPGAPALPGTETAQTGQHELPTLLWQRVNSALEGTHLGMFLLHIPSGLTLSVKTAKGSKLVSSVTGFPPARRDRELPAAAKLSQNTHSYFQREDKSKQLFLSFIQVNLHTWSPRMSL